MTPGAHEAGRASRTAGGGPQRRRLLIFCVLVSVAALGCSPAGETPAASVDPAKERIRDFWLAFRNANRLRVEGRFEEAAPAYRECLKLDPKHEESLFYLGASLEQLGRYSEAAEAYERLLAVNPGGGRALSQYAALLSTPAPGAPLDFDRAEKLLRRLLEVNQEQSGPFLQLGRLHLHRGDLDAAYDEFLLAGRSGSPEGFAWAGYAAFLQGRPQEARTHFRQTLDIQRHERRLAGAGIRAEGDVLPSPDRPLAALDQAALIAAYFGRAIDAGALKGEPMRKLQGRKGFKFDEPSPLVFDYDGDGRHDWLEVVREAGGKVEARLYRGGGSPSPVWQVKSDSTIVDTATTDLNADGRTDILLLCWRQGLRLFWNAGGGRWREADQESGLRSAGKEALSLATLDYDRDGRVDIFLATSAPSEDALRCALQPEFSNPATAPKLYRNLGEGGFGDVSAAAGLTRSFRAMRSEAKDFNSDGWTDIILEIGGHGIVPMERRVLLKNIRGRFARTE